MYKRLASSSKSLPLKRPEPIVVKDRDEEKEFKRSKAKPTRDFSFVDGFDHYNHRQKAQVRKIFSDLAPKIDKQIEGIYTGLDGHLREMMSQPRINVVSLASGEGQEFPGLLSYCEKRGVDLNYVGIDNQDLVISDTIIQFKQYGNHTFYATDASSAKAVCALPEVADPGKTDMVIMRHPEMFGPYGSSFMKMLTEVAPNLLKKGGFVNISFYFKQEHDNFVELFKANKYGLKSTFKFVSRKVNKNGVTLETMGRPQTVDHYQILLKLK